MLVRAGRRQDRAIDCRAAYSRLDQDARQAAVGVLSGARIRKLSESKTRWRAPWRPSTQGWPAVAVPSAVYDDAVMESDEGWAETLRNTRHIGDFRLWKEHDAYVRASGAIAARDTEDAVELTMPGLATPVHPARGVPRLSPFTRIAFEHVGRAAQRRRCSATPHADTALPRDPQACVLRSPSPSRTGTAAGTSPSKNATSRRSAGSRSVSAAMR